MLKAVQNKPYLFWALVGAAVYIPFLGSTHLFDWDEVNFAESAREMIVTGDFLSVQINFQPFWEKPPLFLWLQALSFMAFDSFSGQSDISMEFAARFPNAVIGILTLWTLHAVGKKTMGANFGNLWAFSYLVAITPHVYASSGIIDPLFNLLIFLGVYFYSEFFQDSTRLRQVVFAGIAIGLALLTKGPAALLLWALTLLFVGIVYRSRVNKRLFIGAVVAGLISVFFFLAWYGLIAYKFGWQIIEDFFSYQVRLMTTGDAGHGQPFYYHFVVLLVGCFPISIWAGARLFRWKREDLDFSNWMKVLFWVVLILFSIVKTKIVHYSSMCWIPLTYFSAVVLQEWQLGEFRFNRKYTTAIGFVGLLLAAVLTAVPLIGQNAGLIAPYIKDVFVQGNLQAPVYWAGWEFLIGAAFAAAVIYYLFTKKLHSLMAASLVTIMAYMAIVVPKIEGYTQATVIDFYVAKAGQKVYIETIGFKSYAHLLYFQKPAGGPTGDELMATKKLDRPAYIVMKADVKEELKYHPNLILLKEENGFLFYKHR
jgi:4-amino-4-deoxy-L-arabinose transferase-like glycosyltransferase